MTSSSSNDVQTWVVEKPFVNRSCALGEGPHWEPSTKSLRYVDIINKQIHHVKTDGDFLDGTAHSTLQLKDSVGFTADIEGRDDIYVAGAKYGYAIVERATGELKYFKKLWQTEKQQERMRSNDGAVDSKGRFWLGTMNDFHCGEPQKEGILFRLQSDGSVDEVIQGVAIPNGTAWTADDKTMYFTDSPNVCVHAYDFDAATGAMTNQRVFFDIKAYYGASYNGEVPDGCTIDSEDHLWIAIHEGSVVLRVSPEGKVVGQVKLPAWKITCPLFGGENLDELFITSAGLGDDGEKGPEGSDFHGCTFRVKVGVKGVPANKVRLEEGVLERLLAEQ
ncbi:regucalcin like protein [Ascobolus immersus RN42]|uniref:Regucalcin like protein n=1 Tax=Ascobolus immersus RN42 TaxID=1160509 RepID=A0A3N4IFM8_ASCIM|nr:regucalcin like protein [Ascobolus immersus RN42]